MSKKDKNSQSIGKVFKYQFGNLISMPMIAPSNTNAGEKQREVLSYIPITDVAVDIEKAALNPTKTNVVNAGATVALNALGAKYLKYLTKGSKEIKQMAKVAKDKYDELIKLLNKNRNSVVRSRSTREEATRLGNQAQSVLSDYYAYNRAANIQKVPEYFVYSIWPFADAGINYTQNSLQSKKQGGKINVIEQFKSGGFIRKMQTASGGPLRIKFTPEQIAQFESQATRVPGMNVNSNSTVGEAAKKVGEASVRQTNRKNAEKAEEFNKRNEMRSRVPVGERSGEVIYETKETGPKVIGMSGRDPLLGTLFDLYVGGKGLSALGKTAKYYFKNNKALKGFNYNDLPREKYTYNDKTGDWNIDAPKKEWVKIGENDLVPDYFQSRAEYDRLIASGVSPEEAAEIMETRYLNVINARPGIFRNLGRWPYGESRVENGIIQPVYNSRKHVQGSLNDAKTTLNTVFHELGGHGSSMNVQYGVPLEGVSDDFALRLFKILEHNEKLRPKLRPFFQAVKDGNIQKAKELIPKDGSYLKGMNGEINVKKIQEWIKYMEENQEYSARAIGSNMSNHYGMPNGFNEKQLREIFTDESVDNLLKNVWNYGVPVTTGGYTLYNLFNQPQQQLQYQKQGGKMNILEFLKNGSGIHIKEKNKGKFTSYCGGKVTDECIQKGKNSSNPAIRKRATFAANARKWKHKEGGKAFVKGVNVLDSNPDAYKYVKKKYKMRSAAEGMKMDWIGTAGNLINNGMNIFKAIKSQKAVDELKQANASKLNATKNQAINDYYRKSLAIQSDRSDIVNRTNAYNEATNSASQIVAQKQQELDQQVSQAEQANAAAQQEAWTGAIKDLGGLAINALNKKGMTQKAANQQNNTMFSKNVNVGGTDYKAFNTPTYKSFGDWADANTFKKEGTIDSNGFMNTRLGKMDMNFNIIPIKTELFKT